MFRQLFNFGFQRTALQAFGWYLFFFLLAVLLAMAARFIALSVGYVSANDLHMAAVLPVMVGVVLLLEKPFTLTSAIVTLIAFGLAFWLGWSGAGIPLAFLTTRPSRTPVSGQPIKLRQNAWRQR